MAGQSQRITSFDYLKVWAALFVVVIHANTFQGVNEVAFGVLNNIARFAVAFFFAVSGYFFALKLIKTDAPWKTWWGFAWRILILLVGWSLFYKIVPAGFLQELFKGNWGIVKVIPGAALELLKHPIASSVEILGKGGAVHLWFFSGLLQGSFVWVVCLALGLGRYALRLSLLFFAVGLWLIIAFKGLVPDCMYWGNGPFLSASLFAFSYAVARQKISLGLLTSWGLVILGLAIRFVEAIWGVNAIYHSYSASWQNVDQYTIGATLMAIGLFFVAIASPQLGKGGFWVRLAPLSLGIYALHPFWLHNFPGSWAESMPAYLWPLVQLALAFGLSALSAWLLGKIPGVRRLVR